MGTTTNLIIFPSWETNTSGWSATGLTTYERVTGGLYGTYCAHLADTASAADEYLVLAADIAVTAGTTYTLSAWIKKTMAGGSTGEMKVYWYTAATAFISASVYEFADGSISTWTRCVKTAVAPPTAAKAFVLIADGGITGAWEMWIDGVQFEAQADATAYCDGDQPGCVWNGTAHASTSSRVAGATYTTISITDGTTTLTLTDGRNYALVDGGWSPNVAALRRSTLGRSGPYEDVTEQITVDVLGETGVEALFNLGELSRMSDQAERWARGEPVTAVLLTCQPQGSTLAAALSCVILGRAGETAVNPPATFNDLLMIYEIPNVQLSFKRRGQWLAAAETPDPTAAADNPTVQTITFGSSAAIQSPAKVLVTGLNLLKNASYLLIAKSTDRLALIEAETFGTTSGAWSVVSDSANKARGGSVLRYTPAGTTTVRNTLALSPSLLASGVGRVGVFVALRNNSATVTWRLRLTGNISGTHEAQAAELLIDTTANPRIVYLGMLAYEGTLSSISLDVTASSTSGSPTIDFDYVALHVMDDATSTAIAFKPVTGTSGEGVLADARALTKPAALAMGFNAVNVPVAYAGDAWVNTSGTTLVETLLMTGGNAATAWRCTTAAGAVSQTQLTVTRNLAYLTPQ